MTGKLTYLEPAEEVGYIGGWVVKIQNGKSYNNIFKVCEKSLSWIEENNPPKEMEVEFTVFCDCYYNEETNTAIHGLLARLNVL